jgi:hypothetical protein
MGLNDEAIACLKYHPEVVLISQSNHPNRMILQAGDGFVIQSHIRDEEEFQGSATTA